MASDLAAVASCIRGSLVRRWRPPPQASAPVRIARAPVFGHVLRYLGFGLLAVVSGCTAGVSGVTLWLLYGLPGEQHKGAAQHSESELRLETRNGESLARIEPLRTGEASAQTLKAEPQAQGRGETPGRKPSIAFLGPSAPAQRDNGDGASGASSPNAAEPKTANREAPPSAGAGSDPPRLARTQTQDQGAPDQQPEVSRSSTDSRPRISCNVEMCAATYKSFNAADCTYQAYGGGPRGVCELSTRSGDASPQTARAASEARSAAENARIAEKPDETATSAMPAARAGPQCNVDLCAATYASFHAADCTYQPHGGGPRRICER